MNWIIYSLLMFCFSVLYYLFVRKAKDLKAPVNYINLFNFFVPIVIIPIIIFFNRISFSIELKYLLIIFLTALIGNYIGSIFSIKGIKAAPNPGFSLIIQKSYAVYTSIAAYFLFDSELTVKNALAVLIIIFFAAVISIDKRKSSKSASNLKWVFHSFLAFILFGLNALVSKFLINEGISVFILIFYTMSLSTLFALIDIFLSREKYSINRINLLPLLGIGTFATGFYIFMQLGYKTTPNIGYVNIVNTSSITVLTILSTLIFKDELTLKKIIGVIGITLGLVILFV